MRGRHSGARAAIAFLPPVGRVAGVAGWSTTNETSTPIDVVVSSIAAAVAIEHRHCDDSP
jgi:hypothetical protein